jgi:hypothetical protein
MASAWVSDPAWSPRPKNLTLLWPPAQLETAMTNLDLYVEAAQKEECNVVLTVPLFVRYLMVPKTPSGISERSGKCIASWGAKKAFLKHLVHLSEVMSELKGGQVMRPKNFQQFFQSLHQPFWKLIEAKDEKLNLAYWLKGIKGQHIGVDVRILTSYDDFLNRGIPLSEVARHVGLPKENVVVFDWGGHCGPIGTPEFTSMLQMEFGQEKEN